MQPENGNQQYHDLSFAHSLHPNKISVHHYSSKEKEPLTHSNCLLSVQHLAHNVLSAPSHSVHPQKVSLPQLSLASYLQQKVHNLQVRLMLGILQLHV